MDKRYFSCIYRCALGASHVSFDTLRYFLVCQAEHESPVSAIGLSPDGLRIAVGCEGGSVGVMDVPTHQYDTLLRSHTGSVTMIDADPIREQFVSTSEDGTIRVWDLNRFVDTR
mmetsp:Transcript_29515/g.74224  ORF Transcript_29515/g.74224 Transcript_29515/m.74224 type:complete len:114 (+) Transcript_29515:828-1169(+)